MSAGLLAGSAALVTGAGRGIGRAIALEMARAGADLVLFGRTAADLQSAAGKVRGLGRGAVVCPGDVRAEAPVAAAFEAGRRAFGRVDVVVNNAGVLRFSRFWEYQEDAYRETMDTNLWGTLLVSQVAARHWLAGGVPGRIVNIASIESEIALPEQAPYAASKGGVLTMTKVLARELGPHGIRVNAIGPGPIDTPISQRFRAATEPAVVLGRLGEPAEVGRAAVFLASEMSSFVTGTILYVDGGYLLS